MSLELTSVDAANIDTLWRSWTAAADTELEATIQYGDGRPLDYTAFLGIIKTLRAMGLQEETLPPKLNIMVGSGLRFTLVGEKVVSDYCRDNNIRGKPFHVIKKDKKLTGVGDLAQTDLKDYGVRIKIRRELPLSMDDPYVIDALSRWATLPKSFRYIQRYSFTSAQHRGIQFDLSCVRENFKDRRGNYVTSTTFVGANVTKQPTHYEAEVEALRGPTTTMKSFLVGIAAVMRGIHKSYVVVRESVKQQVRELLAAQTRSGAGRFPGAQPVTLHRAHMETEQEPDTPNIRTGDYNVTDKADGLRCLLVVARNGRIYMVDRSLNVYGTDRRIDDALTSEWAGAILDGEWVTQDATGAPMSRYYAFDIFNGRRGEDVTGRPFLVRAETAVSRLAALTEAVAVLDGSMKVVAGIPKHHSLSIHIKTFVTPDDPTDPTAIFKKAASVLDRLKTSPPYHTDGLIFTPNAAPLPRTGGKWVQQLKWKPASQNSVDFLVLTEKERGIDGRPGATDLVSTRLNEETNQIVRYKTLRLFVGSAQDPAFVDPRDTVLNKKPYPAQLNGRRGDYRPVEFAPSPPDPMAAICYVALNAGATDAAGAAPAAGAIAAAGDDIMLTEDGDPIASRTIVEMSYDPSRPAGWRWIPMRVRWDKTEQFARRQIGGTLNSEENANDVWSSIHNPVTENMIRTGAITDEASAGAVAGAEAAVAYYQRRAPQRDLLKVSGMTEFHSRYIKERILLGRTVAPGAALLDMSVGQAGDLHKWERMRVGWVLGCDLALSGLVDKHNGAYARYLKKIIQTRGTIPRMVFIQADSSRRYMDGSAGMSPLDRAMLRTLWGENEASSPPLVQEMRGAAAAGFDVSAMMFALHYMFKDRPTLDGFLRNLAESVRVGGFFVGCCFDGDRVAAMLRDMKLGDVRRGTENLTDLWTITKQYDDGGSGVLEATDEGLGRAIDVNFISLGDEKHTEYLVSWTYLVAHMASIGFDLLNEEELGALGLSHSTNLFSESYAMAQREGLSYPMSPVVREFSFLNRWFIFRRRSTGTGAPLAAPAVEAAPTVEERVEAAGPMTAAMTAPVPDATEELPAEADVSAAEEAAAGAPPPPPEGSNAATAEEPVLALADGPVYQFYHKSGAKDELKVGNKHWRRYLSTYAPYRYRDVSNPEIYYTSLEAALGAAKYQFATNKPELGAQIFSEVGNIAQATYARRTELTGAGAGARALTEDEKQDLMETEGNAMRDAQKPAAFRKTGAKFNAEAWDGVKERVLTEYVRQRYENDKLFKTILDAVAKQKARLVYFTAGGATDMSGSIKGDVPEGENLYGRALMRVVGLRY